MTSGRPVGYLFTDIDGSVSKWEKAPSAMAAAHARHDAILKRIINACGGSIEEHAGDGVFARFDGGDPLGCMLKLQKAIRSESWDDVGGLAVRMGLHVGVEGVSRQRDRLAVNRAARMCAAAWGGQSIASALAAATFQSPDDAVLSDLGGVYLRGINEPQRLFSLTCADFGQEDFPPPRGAARQSPSLPGQTTPIFGRDAQLDDLNSAFEAGHRWVTVTGAGGVGKTRLALEFAGRIAGAREVHLVMLAPGPCDAGALTRSLVSALRLPIRSGIDDGALIIDYLRQKTILLVVDNADGLDEEAAAIFAALLEEARGLCLLVTSREAFMRTGERIERLFGLDTPAGKDTWQTSPAAMLFAQSARAVDPQFRFSTTDAAAFSIICDAVRGVPLALHLTAQWVRVFSLIQIAEKLAGGTQLLSSLERGSGRTLREVFDGSWALLNEAQQRAMAALAIFPSTFDARAAEAIASVEPSQLQALERKSLLERRSSHRFALHPLVREFASEKLRRAPGDLEADLARRHADYYIARCDEDFAATLGPEQPRIAERARAEFANVSAAWDFKVKSPEAGSLIEAAERLFYIYATAAMFFEALSIFSQRPRNERLGAAFAALRANCLQQLGRLREAEAVAREAQSMLAERDRSIAGHAWHVLGNVAHTRGEWTAAEGHYRSALTAREGDRLGAFYTNLSLAWLALHRGQSAAARPFVDISDRLAQDLGFIGGAMMVRACAGDIACAEEKLEEAAACYRSAMTLEANFDNPQHGAMLRMKLGRVLLRAGEDTEAEDLLCDAVEIARERGEERASVRALVALGFAPQIAPDRARTHLGEALWRAVRKLNGPTEIKLALSALALFEAKQGQVRRAGELVGVAQALKLVMTAEEEETLTALGVEMERPEAVLGVDSALTALICEYAPTA